MLALRSCFSGPSMPPFAIGAPIATRDQVAITARVASFRRTVASLLALPALVLAVWSGWAFCNYVIAILPVFYVGLDAGAVALSVMAPFLALFGLLGWWRDSWVRLLPLLAPVDGTSAERMLSLCAQYPPIDTHRLAILQSRELLVGDFEAMKAFALKYDHDYHETALRQKQESMLHRLRELAPVDADGDMRMQKRG